MRATGSRCAAAYVSDACGQLMLEKALTPGLKGLAKYAQRAMDMLMERVRLANFADLSARKLSGLLRGLMFLHMKAGLDADTIRRTSSQEGYRLERVPLSRSGVRKEFQQVLAELRTDLDDFTQDESLGLMACGYQMAAKTFETELATLRELWTKPTSQAQQWPFHEMLAEITSTKEHTPNRERLLSDASPFQVSTAFAETADLVVLIVAESYGSIVPDRGFSFTEAELNIVLRDKVPCLVYIKTADESKLDGVSERLKDGAPR